MLAAMKGGCALNSQHPAFPLPYILFPLLLTRGFGSGELFKLIVGLCFGLLLFLNIRARDRVGLITTALSFLFALLWWQVVYLFGFWIVILAIAGRNGKSIPNSIPSALLVIWILQEFAVGNFTYVPYLVAPTYILICWLGNRVNSIIYSFLAVICALCTIFEIARPRADVQVQYNRTLADGYSYGKILAKIIGAELISAKPVAGTIGITSLTADGLPNNSLRPIHLLEHGLASSLQSTPIINGDIAQTRPWTRNQLMGNQYLLAALGKDRQWVSNLGGRLEFTGRVLLASTRHSGGHYLEPIVTVYKDTTYINDSDPFVDRLANYQSAALWEIVHKTKTFRIANLAMLIGSLLVRRSINASLLGMIAGLILVAFPPSSKGDIRIIGNVGWPHESSKISGTLRSLADTGYTYLRGTKNCKALIVDSGKSTRVRDGEKIVIGLPGATIKIRNHIVTVSDLPVGNLEGITDARNLLVDLKVGRPIIRLGDVTVIGTGSPAKLEWSKWLE